MIKVDDAQQQSRKRRHHTRSRNGCSACKERHVRCDEIRPTCSNCSVGNRDCRYAPPSFPLRDRRLGQPDMPGFMVWQLPNGSPDPSDASPMKTPEDSNELFHYFTANPKQRDWTSSGAYLGIPANIFTPGDPRADWHVDVDLPSQEPTALRGTHLMAALHYSWKTGSLNDYENTFLHHKGESIRLVNEWLGHPDARTSAACMKLIATLSVTESCIGNFPAADAHLDGLLTLLDMKEAERASSGPSADDEDQDDEVLQRLIIIAHNFSRAIKSRLAEGLARQVDLFDIWQKSFPGLAENLTALRLIPFYFPTAPDLRVARDVDPEPVIDALRGITYAVVQNETPQARVLNHCVYDVITAPSRICDSEDSTTCDGCKSLSGLFLAYTEAHVTSLSRDPRSPASPPAKLSQPQLLSSWVGLATAADFYLNTVLRLWNGGTPEEPRLFDRLIRMLKKDIAGTEAAALRAGKGTLLNALWFWKVFMGAYASQCLAESQSIFKATPPQEDHPQPSERLNIQWFGERIRRWGQLTGTLEWREARAMLMEIVYPESPAELEMPQMPQRIWERAALSEFIPIDLSL